MQCGRGGCLRWWTACWALAPAVMCAETRTDNLQPVEMVGYREGMAITATRQRNAVSEGAALGLVMCGHFDIPSETWRVSLAFEGAWRAWEDRYKRPSRRCRPTCDKD